MRLNIEFMADGNTVLPYSYRRGLQAFIYSALDSKDSAYLHDMEAGRIKPFVFSDILGRYQAIDRGIVFDGKCTFYLSSPSFNLLNEFYNFCIKKETLSLYGNYFPLTRISEDLYKHKDGTVSYRTISPLTVFDIDSNGHSYFYNPDQDEFKEKITDNLSHKYLEIYGKQMDSYFNIYRIEELKRHVVEFKGFKYDAYDISFMADCKDDIHTLMMDCGIGNRNSIGMGMIEYYSR